MKLIEINIFIFLIGLTVWACNKDNVDILAHDIEDSLYIKGTINGKYYERTGENYNRNTLFYRGGDSLVFKAFGASHENFFDYQRLEIFFGNSFDISLLEGFKGYYAYINTSNDFVSSSTFYKIFSPGDFNYLNKLLEGAHSYNTPFIHPGEGVFILLTEKSKDEWYSYNKVDDQYFTTNTDFKITDLEILNSNTPSSVYRFEESRYVKVRGEFSCWLYNHAGDSMYVDNIRFENVFHE